jgi:hypothetical protein
VATVALIAAFVACLVTTNRRLHAGVVMVIVGMEVIELASWAVRGQSAG